MTPAAGRGSQQAPRRPATRPRSPHATGWQQVSAASQSCLLPGRLGRQALGPDCKAQSDPWTRWRGQGPQRHGPVITHPPPRGLPPLPRGGVPGRPGGRLEQPCPVTDRREALSAGASDLGDAPPLDGAAAARPPPRSCTQDLPLPAPSRDLPLPPKPWQQGPQGTGAPSSLQKVDGQLRWARTDPLVHGGESSSHGGCRRGSWFPTAVGHAGARHACCLHRFPRLIETRSLLWGGQSPATLDEPP